MLKGFLTLRSKKHEGQISRDAIKLAKIYGQVSDISLAKFQPGEIRPLYRTGSNQLGMIQINSDDPASRSNPMCEMKGRDAIPTHHIQYGCAFMKIQMG
jgi:hypothetical protein